MKICPYCDNPIPEREKNCPSCGAFYWESNQDNVKDAQEKMKDEESKGCMSLFLLPLFFSAALSAFFILVGAVIQLIIHFEDNQINHPL